MLKFTRNSVIAFDFPRRSSFEGDSGPYLQYAVVRARNILRKLARSASTPLYHHHPILHAEDESTARARLACFQIFARGLRATAALLGLPEPERM
jgi:arginyl-tRNA synthetase